MRFYEGLPLEVYIYTDEQIELKKIDALDDELEYDSETEVRWFYSVDSTYKSKDDERISIIASGGEEFYVKMKILDLNNKLKEHGYVWGKG